MSDQSSPDGVGRFAGDAKDVASAGATWVSLTDQVIGDVRSMSILAAERIKRERQLKADLGEWIEMVKRDGRWYLPVLRMGGFRKHLEEKDGCFTPCETCHATYGWAKMLHALDISPSSSILEWNDTPAGYDPLTQGPISLQVDGSVLCDIINIYQLYSGMRRTGDGLYIFPFGTLRVRRRGSDSTSEEGSLFDVDSQYGTDPGFDCDFKAYSSEALSSPRTPFCHEAMHIRPELCLEEGTVYISYRNALEYGISDTRAALGIAQDHQNEPRKARAWALINAMQILRSKDQLFLVTDLWVNNATHIKKRITVNPSIENGADLRFCNWLTERLNESGVFRDTVNRHIGNFSPQLQDDIVTGIVKAACLAEENDTFEFCLHDPDRSSRYYDVLIKSINKELPSILRRLGHPEQPWGQWFEELVEMKEELATVLRMPQYMEGRPVLRLKFTDKHMLWHTENCYIK
ncbi:hypothetical protein V8C35DRAFT_317413 [Trichoderma chlorosporum]